MEKSNEKCKTCPVRNECDWDGCTHFTPHFFVYEGDEEKVGEMLKETIEMQVRIGYYKNNQEGNGGPA